jgi:hypothetical protein
MHYFFHTNEINFVSIEHYITSLLHPCSFQCQRFGSYILAQKWDLPDEVGLVSLYVAIFLNDDFVFYEHFIDI